VPGNFPVSARLGRKPYFVIEADEYDTAFFDKRSKFVHYRPRTAVLNNLEYDHADIFPDLGAIETQFHHLVRTVPGQGRIIWPSDSEALQRVLGVKISVDAPQCRIRLKLAAFTFGRARPQERGVFAGALERERCF